MAFVLTLSSRSDRRFESRNLRRHPARQLTSIPRASDASLTGEDARRRRIAGAERARLLGWRQRGYGPARRSREADVLAPVGRLASTDERRPCQELPALDAMAARTS